jgi:large subunit ribosomal protein L11
MTGIVKIAKMKMDVSYALDLKNSSKEIIWSCVSNGIKVENKPPKDIYIDIESGKYESLFQ